MWDDVHPTPMIHAYDERLPLRYPMSRHVPRGLRFPCACFPPPLDFKQLGLAHSRCLVWFISETEMKWHLMILVVSTRLIDEPLFNFKQDCISLFIILLTLSFNILHHDMFITLPQTKRLSMRWYLQLVKEFL